MAGAGAMGGAGGTGGSGGTGGDESGGRGGTAGGGSGGTAGGGSGGTAGSDEDDDGGVVEEDASTPDPVLPMDGDALSVCESTDDCNGDDLVCAVFGNAQGYCAEDCADDADCDAVDGVDAFCDNDDRCVIDCSEEGSDGDCPTNMVCIESTTSVIADPIFRCQYPEPKNLDMYEVCDPDRGNADCKVELTCQVFPGLTDLRDSSCVAGCMEADDCDDLDSEATAVCDLEPLSDEGVCALECEQDEDCPSEMTCIETDLVTMRCGHRI